MRRLPNMFREKFLVNVSQLAFASTPRRKPSRCLTLTTRLSPRSNTAHSKSASTSRGVSPPPLPSIVLADLRLINKGITKTPRSEWIEMDSGYLNRIKDRMNLMRTHPDQAHIVGTNAIVNPAICELYTEIMIEYLPQRYPTMF